MEGFVVVVEWFVSKDDPGAQSAGNAIIQSPDSASSQQVSRIVWYRKEGRIGALDNWFFGTPGGELRIGFAGQDCDRRQDLE